jgi:hypothetical protein
VTGKVKIIMLDETKEEIHKFSEKYEVGGSACVAASVQYFTWLVSQINGEGYSLVLEKRNGMETTCKELAMPKFLNKKK